MGRRESGFCENQSPLFNEDGWFHMTKHYYDGCFNFWT